MRRTITSLLLTLFVFASSVVILPPPRANVLAGAQSAGGSNYNFYQLDGCIREPYGVVNNYQQASATIMQQLQQMRANGQARLRIGIFHHNGSDTGTVMNSAGGNLSLQNRANLTALLAAIKAAGFSEVLIAMHPIGVNDPSYWTNYNQTLYNENRTLIYNLRPIIASAGISYKIDLMNEGIPSSNQSNLLTYSQRLWSDCTARYGKSDTVGFSVIGSEPVCVARIKQVYGTNQPYLFDFHFYGNASADEYQQFITANNSVKQQGFGAQGRILGESFYNDQTVASNFTRAIQDTGRTVYYQLQWPITRAQTCANVDVAPPVVYSNYL